MRRWHRCRRILGQARGSSRSAYRSVGNEIGLHGIIAPDSVPQPDDAWPLRHNYPCGMSCPEHEMRAYSATREVDRVDEGSRNTRGAVVA